MKKVISMTHFDHIYSYIIIIYSSWALCFVTLAYDFLFQEFEIRELAICTIGRLSSLNPAYIMPSLRKTLIQVQTT